MSKRPPPARISRSSQKTTAYQERQRMAAATRSRRRYTRASFRNHWRLKSDAIPVQRFKRKSEVHPAYQSALFSLNFSFGGGRRQATLSHSIGKFLSVCGMRKTGELPARLALEPGLLRLFHSPTKAPENGKSPTHQTETSPAMLPGACCTTKGGASARRCCPTLTSPVCWDRSLRRPH
jgi:hypothetical protein